MAKSENGLKKTTSEKCLQVLTTSKNGCNGGCDIITTTTTTITTINENARRKNALKKKIQQKIG